MSEALRGYRLLVLWEFKRMRSEFLLTMIVQVVLALGVVYGFALLIPNLTRESALYLSTGAPTLSLLILGLTVVPQDVARSKLTGRLEYLRALPLAPLALMAATVTFWLVAQLPGTAMALIVSNLRFDIALTINWLVLPVILLVTFTAASVGYALAQATSPGTTQQLTSFLSIGLFLFSPINFPIDRLPDALEAIHLVLPITYMADLIRWSLTGAATHAPAQSFAVLGAWCALGLAISYRVATRRR